jgi:fumarylacetoacetate (FAA) hydrolase
MKLSTHQNGRRDGELMVVCRDLTRWTSAKAIVPTLQAALDDWDQVEARLRALAAELEAGAVPSEPFRPSQCAAPLPRAYEWVDGSAYLQHVILVRKARGAALPPTLRTDPLVYQGGSGVLLGPTADVPLADPAWGLDFESEVCVVLGDTPLGTSAGEAEKYVRLVMLANDLTLRTLIPDELAKGFGFFHGKPATAFSPVAVTPDELGPAFRGGRVHRRLRTTYNGTLVGDPEAGPEMWFSFFDLVAHVTKTRSLTAGTILGSGTVSNEDRARGVSCLAERRMIETIEGGAPVTPFMKPGDRVVIEMLDDQGKSIFGAIDQRVVTMKRAGKPGHEGGPS